MKKILLVTLSFFCVDLLLAQLGPNLVPNGGFEIFTDKQSKRKWLKKEDIPVSFRNLNFWKNPSRLTHAKPHANQLATPDFFVLNNKQLNNTSIETKFGQIYPMGKGVTGIMVFNGQNISKGNYREYITVALRDELEIGKEYEISFAITNGKKIKKDQGDYSRFGITDLGVLLSHQMPVQDGTDLINAEPQWKVKECIYSEQWVKQTFIYKATEKFRHLTIGNFNDDYDVYFKEKTSYRFIVKNEDDIAGDHCYYFIDQISVREKEDKDVPHEEAIASTPKVPETGRVGVSHQVRKGIAIECQVNLNLPNLLFASDRSFFRRDVQKEAFNEMDIIVDYMKSKAELYIEIEGHTEAIKSVNSRDTLLAISLGRAEAVRSYLEKNGIAPNRISTIGYGPDRPRKVVKNKSKRAQREADRANRRVEVVFFCSTEFDARKKKSRGEKPAPEKASENENKEVVEILEKEVVAKDKDEIDNNTKRETDITSFDLDKVVSVSPHDTLQFEKGQKFSFNYSKQTWKSPNLKEEKGVTPLNVEIKILKVKRNVSHSICDGKKEVTNDWYEIEVVDNGQITTGWIFGLNFCNLRCY